VLNTSRKVGWPTPGTAHCVGVGGLGIDDGKARVDLDGLSACMTRVGLDQRVVDDLLLQPGQQKVAQALSGFSQQLVRRDRQLAEPLAGGVKDGVRDGRRDAYDGELGETLHA